MADEANDEGNQDERSWLPIALAGGFLAFSLLVAVLVNLGDDDSGDPSTARTVLDVASLTVAAVEDHDATTHTELQCDAADDALTPYLAGAAEISASYDNVTGLQTGAFNLAIEGDQSAQFVVTVDLDGDRSCIAAVKLTEATR